MPFDAKPLADGQLGTAKGTLYTVPEARAAYVRTITLYNSNAIAQVVKLYLKPGATSRVFYYGTLAQYTHIHLTLPITLSEGDLIEGETTTAAAVDYVITGAEET